MPGSSTEPISKHLFNIILHSYLSRACYVASPPHCHSMHYLPRSSVPWSRKKSTSIHFKHSSSILPMCPNHLRTFILSLGNYISPRPFQFEHFYSRFCPPVSLLPYLTNISTLFRSIFFFQSQSHVTTLSTQHSQNSYTVIKTSLRFRTKGFAPHHTNGCQQHLKRLFILQLTKKGR